MGWSSFDNVFSGSYFEVANNFKRGGELIPQAGKGLSTNSGKKIVVNYGQFLDFAHAM